MISFSRIVLASFGLLSLIACGCSMRGEAGAKEREAAQDENLPRVLTQKVETQDLKQKIELPGTVEADQTVDVQAKVGGFLAELKVDIGDEITDKAVIAKLSIPEMERELVQKELAVASAEADVEKSRAAVLQAKASVEIAKTNTAVKIAMKAAKKALVESRKRENDRVKTLVGSSIADLREEIRYKYEAAVADETAAGKFVDAAREGEKSAQADVTKAIADLNAAIAHVDFAIADYQRVAELVEYGNIRAPFTGVVLKRMVDPGQFIQPAEGNSAAKPLLTVAKTDTVRIRVDLPMAEVRWLDKEDEVVFDRIKVLPGMSFQGKVTRFSPSLGKTSRMMRIEIDTKDHKGALRPGYYGYVTLELEELNATPVVPASALLVEGNDTFVFVVSGGVCKKRKVTTNYEDGTIVGIGTGLTAGETIIKAGVGQLSDGQKVVAGE